MKKQTLLAATFLVMGWAVFQACKHEIPLSSDNTDATGTPAIIIPPGISGRTCSADTVYFANSIQPLLNASCAMSGCHDAVSHTEGINLSTYAGILRTVSPGRAGSSKLYSVMVSNGESRMPPLPRPAMTAAQLSIIQKWINQGAMNNVCDACDTANFKYSTAIQPLLQNNCVGCHNAASLGGGIDLSTYTGAKAVAVNGRLLGTVNWLTGFSAMPKGGVKMPDCQIMQIKKWIDAGSPNN